MLDLVVSNLFSLGAMDISEFQGLSENRKKSGAPFSLFFSFV